LQKDNLILNYTPLRPIMKQYTDKLVLINGYNNVKLIAEDCGLTKYITIEEFFIHNNFN